LSSSTDGWVIVGRVGRPHGVRGEVTVLLESDDAEDFRRGSVLRAGERELEVRSARSYRDRGLIVGFTGIDDRNTAEALRGLVLTRDASERRTLGEGEFWSSSLVGLEAVTPDGAVLGRVTEVIAGGFQDRLVVATPSGEEVQVPFVEEIVGDPEGGRVVIDAPEGLFPA
jgi:16S rRNA processing protein RimM